MATPQELADKIKQIEGTLSKLNAREQAYYQGILRDLKANTAELEKFETLFRDVVNAADDLNNELSFISKSFRDSVAELSKQNKELSNAKNALSSISKIAQEIVYENSQGVLIEGKTLDKLEKKAKLQFQSLQIAIQSGRIRGNELKEAKASADQQQKFFEALQNIRKEQEKIKKDAGIKIFTGLEAISSAIPGLSKFSSAFQDASKAAQETAIYNQKIFGTTKGLTSEQKKEGDILNSKIKKYNKLRAAGKGISEALKEAGVSAKQVKIGEVATKSMTPLMAGLKSLGPDLAKSFGPLALLVVTIKELVGALKLIDGLTGDLAKGMNMSYHDASAMSSELNSAANASGDIFVTTKGMQESLLAINKTLGTNVMLNKEDLVTMTKFRTTAGLTNEELAGIYKLTLGTNKSLEDVTGEVLAQAKISSTRLGVALNEKEVLKEIKDVSAATTLSLGKDPELIGKAVAVAKSLGLEMSKIDAIAESLLNFQSSIESELEAELLTGRQLNLEQARYYALTNDVEGLAKEINKNLGSSAEFGKMNRLQQEAIAKSVGMNREELAKTLFIQDQLKDVSKEDVEKREELLNRLTEQYGVEGAQRELKKRSIEDLEKQASIQDRMNASVEKLREMFVAVAEALMPVFDILVDVFKIVGPIVGFIGEMVKLTIQLGKYLLPVYGVYQGIKIIQQSLVTKAVAQYSISKLQKAEDMGINAVRLYRNKIEDQGIAKKIAYNAQVLAGLIQEQGVVGLKTFALTLDDKSIAKKIVMKTYDVASFAIEKGKAIWKGIQIGYETTLNTIKRVGSLIDKGNLIVNIGKAAMGAISSLSSIPVIGWALGLAAAGTSIALGYKFLKGNDIVSPGYGKRTLMSPEGAIALNDKDTIIAGTDLGGKNKSKIQESTSITSSNINIQPLVDEMVAVRAILTSILNKEGNVSIDGNLVGKTLALAEYRTGS
jgi:uncharacterized protein YoxC